MFIGAIVKSDPIPVGMVANIDEPPTVAVIFHHRLGKWDPMYAVGLTKSNYGDRISLPTCFTPDPECFSVLDDLLEEEAP